VTPPTTRGPGPDDAARGVDPAGRGRAAGGRQSQDDVAWWAGDEDEDEDGRSTPAATGARLARPVPGGRPVVPAGTSASRGSRGAGPQDDGSRPDGSQDDGSRDGGSQQDSAAGGSSLPPLPPSSRARRPRDPWLPEHQPFRTLSGPDIAGIVLLGAVGIAVLVVLGLFVLNRFDQRDPVADAPAPTPAVASSAAVASPATPRPIRSVTPSPTTTADLGTPGRLRGLPYVGALDRRTPTGVTASCTDTPTQDTNGDTTYYDASQATDDQPRTAWRCPGRGVGERLTLRFDRPTSVAELSITNGWARRDSGGDRYYQYRRVQKVRWSFDNDRFVEQELDDRDPTPQTLRIPATVTSSVVVEIEDTSSARRNATPISEFAVAGPPVG